MEVTPDQVFAKIGRMQLNLERLDSEHDKMLNYFAAVVSGEISRSRVLVNLTDRTYTIVPEGEVPAMPATINGLPKCVIAPPEPPKVEYKATATLTSADLDLVNKTLEGSGVKLSGGELLEVKDAEAAKAVEAAK